MKKITSNSTIEEVMASIGVGPEEKLRESLKREKTLEKFAQMRSRNPNTTVSLNNTPTAFVKVDEELDEFTDITVTTKKFEQVNTNLPDKYHDYIIQTAMNAHEIGHILYSDWPSMEFFMDKAKADEMDYEGVTEGEAESYQLMFQNFFNVLEDGAIEKFLGENYRLEEELIYLRSTLHDDRYFGQEYPIDTDGDGNAVKTEYHYPFFYAVMTAALNLGVYDNGELDKLLDDDNDEHIFAIRGGEVDREMFIQEVIPMLRSYIPKIHSETDAEKRANLIYDLWTEVRKYIDRSQTSGRVEFENQMKQSESNSYMEGVPENLSEGHGDQEKEPMVVEIVEESDNGDEGAGADGEEGEEQTYGEKAGDKAKSSHESEGVGSIEEKARKGIIAETKQESGDWSEELEEIIDSLGAGDGVDEIAIPDDGVVNQSRMEEAKNLSRGTSRLFARRLRRLKRDKVVRNKERGIFDSRALIPAERGSTRAFKQTEEGDQKDYRCMIVLDRSGSMSGRIDEVELAGGAIAWGLEDNGIDTSILDTESSMTTLSKPFGAKTEQFKQKIFAGRYGGGTPLSHTVKFARQRMKRGEGEYPFMIIVTDGRPRRVKQFKDQVRKANFPVLGLYLTNSEDHVKDQLSLYDRAVVATHDDDVNQILINLINSVMF